jgi:hypothetical protein
MKKSIDDKNDINKMVMYIEYNGGVPVFAVGCGCAELPLCPVSDRLIIYIMETIGYPIQRHPFRPC